MRLKNTLIMIVSSLILLFSFSSKNLAADQLLKDVPIGTVVHYGATDWYVIGESYLVMKNSYQPFTWKSTNDYTNYYNLSDGLASYLNNGFYNSISNKSWIKPWDYHIGPTSNEASRIVNAKVGILSYSEYNAFKTYIGSTLSYPFWLINQPDNFSGVGRIISAPNTLQYTTLDNICNVYPTIHMIDGLMVDANMNVYKLAPEGSIVNAAEGDRVVFGGKRWMIINKNNRELLLDYNDGNRVYSLTGGAIANNYFNPDFTNNIANYLNTTFLNSLGSDKNNVTSRIWETATNFYTLANVGLLDIPTYNDLSNKRILTPVNFPWWLLNHDDVTNGYRRYVSTISSYNLKWNTWNAALVTNNLGTRPVVRLKPGETITASGQVLYNTAPNILLATSSNLAVSADGTVTLSGVVTDAEENNLTITASINGVTKTTTVNSAPITSPGVNNWSLTWNVSELAEGDFTNITITANDGSLTSNIKYNATITVDKTAPIINIANPLNNSFTNVVPLLFYTANEGLVVIRVDGIILPLISGDTLGALSDGQHSVTVTATDAAGNTSSASALFTIDSTAPTITLLPPPGNSTSDNTPLLNYTVSDGTVVVKVDGAVVNKVSGDSLDTLSEGSHTVTVEATDAAGNVGTESITFSVDSTPPSIGITSPLDGSLTTDDTPQLDFSVSEGTAIVRVDGVMVAKTSGQSLNPLVDGPHTITVEATDAAGNRGSATSTFTVDRGAPMVFVTSPMNGSVIKDKTPQINYMVSDGTVTVKVDGNTVNKVSGDTLDTLTDGVHTLRVESRDGAGNIGSAQVSFTVDSTAPTVNIISPAKGTTVIENTPTLTFFHSDGTAVVKVDGTVVSKISGQQLDTLSNGDHTVTVEATDAAGNKGTATNTFTVNAQIPGQTDFGPIVKIISPVNESTTNNRNPQINYTVSDGTVTVKIDGQITNKTSGQSLDSLAEGYHTLRVESINQKGQIGAAQVIFKVDLSGPTINITSPIAGSTIYEAKPKLTYTISDGTAVVKVDGTVVSKTSGQNLDMLSMGLHTVTIEATDQAGNTSVEQSTFTVSSQISEAPKSIMPDSGSQLPSYVDQTPDNFKYQYDPFSENTNMAGIEAVPMTEQERGMYFSNEANSQDGPLKVIVSPLGGNFENPQVVNLAVNKPAIIYYTTNGTNPTIESDMFSAPILVDQSMTIKYFAKDGEGKPTPIQTQKYLIKNSSKSLEAALKSPKKLSTAENQQLKKNPQDGEVGSRLILTALGWVMLTTAVGAFLTLKG